MSFAQRFRASAALLAVAGRPRAPAQTADATTVMPDSSAFVRQFASVPALAPQLTDAQKQALSKQKIKYVFVLFQEHRSFDHHFGTFPGANGLFCGGKLKPNARGAVQAIVSQDR